MIRFLALALVLLLVGVVGFLYLGGEWREYDLKKQSEPIQAALETYRQQQGRYPDSLAEIGIEEKLEGPIYYQPESNTRYILWYGLTLGESRTFTSEDRQWR